MVPHDRLKQMIDVGTIINWRGRASKRVLTMLIRKFLGCQSGATAIEYGLIAGMIGIAIISAVQLVGIEVQGPFVDATTGLKQRVSP
jgi:pilus assembly protein Flp/PilA